MAYHHMFLRVDNKTCVEQLCAIKGYDNHQECFVQFSKQVNQHVISEYILYIISYQIGYKYMCVRLSINKSR